MAFKPQISACLEYNCSRLTITDTTGPYHAVNNPYGWGNAGTLLEADVDTAEIVIEYTDSEGTTTEVSTTDVTDQIPADVTADFEFNYIEDDYDDGYYTITYNITDTNGVIYSKSIKVFIYCNVKCCIDKLFATVPSKLCECDYKDLLEELFIAEVIFEGIMAAAGCGNVASMYAMLERLEKICAFTDCDCN